MVPHAHAKGMAALRPHPGHSSRSGRYPKADVNPERAEWLKVGRIQTFDLGTIQGGIGNPLRLIAIQIALHHGQCRTQAVQLFAFNSGKETPIDGVGLSPKLGQ